MTKIGAISDPKISALLSEPKLQSVFKPLDELTHRILIDLRVGFHRLRAGARVRVSTREIKHRTSNVQHPIGNGEGGIRTLGTLLGYGALAKRCFRPLSHLTKISRENMPLN